MTAGNRETGITWASEWKKATQTKPQESLACEALEAADAFIKAEHEFRTHLSRSMPSANDLTKAVERGRRYKETKKKAEELINAALALSRPHSRTGEA